MIETISDANVQDFNTSGYWFGPKLFDDAQLADLRFAMDEVFAGRYDTGRKPIARHWNPGDDPYGLHKVDNSFWSNHVLAGAVLNDSVGRLAAKLLDTYTVRLWHEQILMKPVDGHDSATVAWHQDYHYWRSSDRPHMLTAWIPLQDTNVQVGTMHFMVGSHQWGWHNQYSHFGDFDMAQQEKAIRDHMPEGSDFRTTAVELEAGRVSFHHCLTLHGSGPNRAPRQHRYAIAIHVQTDDCCWQKVGDGADNHKCSLMMQELGKRYGDKFKGDHWPVLWSAAEN